MAKLYHVKIENPKADFIGERIVNTKDGIVYNVLNIFYIDEQYNNMCYRTKYTGKSEKIFNLNFSNTNSYVKPIYEQFPNAKITTKK